MIPASPGTILEEMSFSGPSPSGGHAPTSEVNTRTNASQMPIAAKRLSFMAFIPSSDRWRQPTGTGQVEHEQHHADQEQHPSDLGCHGRDPVQTEKPGHQTYDQERQRKR
jgi:hypothetical protein